MDISTVYTSYPEAFKVMHGYTINNHPFKLTFRKIDGTKKIIAKALLRKQTPTSKDKNGSYKINYIDVVNDECGACYIPLLMSINDNKIILK